MRKRGALGIAAIFLIAAMLVSALVGAADLNPLDTVAALADKIPFVHLPSGLSPLDRAVLFQIRLPRVVLCALVGGLLAMAGGGYQGVFHNPLVDSGLLGASAGAGLGATLAIVYFGVVGQGAIPPAAFLGSLGGVAVAYLTGAAASRRTGFGDGVATLLLAGIAVGFFFTAVQTLVLQRSAQQGLHHAANVCEVVVEIKLVCRRFGCDGLRLSGRRTR